MTPAQNSEWQWLRQYGLLALWVGWLLTISALIQLVLISTGMTVRSMAPDSMLPHAAEHAWFAVRTELVPGILALGVAQFVEWLSGSGKRPGWLLRHAPQLFIVAAAVYLVGFVQTLWAIPGLFTSFADNNVGNPMLSAVFIVLHNVLMRLAPVIVFIGLAEASRRMGPIVEESKSLV